MTLNPSKRERAIQLYLETEKSTAEISEEVGISRATLYNWLAVAGVSGRRHRAVSPAVEDADSELEEALRRMTERLDLMATEEKLDDICSKLVDFEEQWRQRRADMEELRHEVAELKTMSRDAVLALSRVQGALEAVLAMNQPKPTGR